MHLPLRRIFDDKRRLVIPVLAGLALNVVLFAGVVYPLGVRVRSMEARAADGCAAAAGRRTRGCRGSRCCARTRSHRHRVEGLLQGRPPVKSRTSAAGHVPAADAARRAAQSGAVAPQHGSHTGERFVAGASADLDALKGDYEDIRRFIYQVETGSDFIVIDSIALRQGEEAGSPLTLSARVVDVLPSGARWTVSAGAS